MKRGTPFARARSMMAAISMMLSTGVSMAQIAGKMGVYESRGHGGKRVHIKGNGSARVKRAATKTKNVRRHRAACR